MCALRVECYIHELPKTLNAQSAFIWIGATSLKTLAWKISKNQWISCSNTEEVLQEFFIPCPQNLQRSFVSFQDQLRKQCKFFHRMDLPKQKNVKKLLGIMSVVLMYRVLTCKLGNSRNISIICTFSVQGVRWPVMLIPPTLAIKGSNFSYNLKMCPSRFMYICM